MTINTLLFKCNTYMTPGNLGGLVVLICDLNLMKLLSYSTHRGERHIHYPLKKIRY